MNGTPVGTPMAGPPRGSGQSDLVKVVGIILMVVGTIGVLNQIISLLTNQPGQMPDMSTLPEQFEQYRGTIEATMRSTVKAGPFIGVLGLLCSLAVVLGGFHMVTRKSYPLALTGAIAASIPCLGPCCCLAFPFGIWSLVLLLRPDVKASFASSGGAGLPPAGPGGVSQIG